MRICLLFLDSDMNYDFKSTDVVGVTGRTLGDIIVWIKAADHIPSRRRQTLTSAVRTGARALGRTPEGVLADASALKAELDLIPASQVGIQPDTWRGTKSQFWAALHAAGVSNCPRRVRRDPLPEWSAFLGGVSDTYDRAKLSRFAGYCSERMMTPSEVCDATMDDFRAAIESENVPRWKQVVRDACKIWNQCSESGYFGQILPVSIPDFGKTYAFKLEDFEQSFQGDFDAYFEDLSKDALFEDVPRKALGPVTLRDRRNQVLELASALVLGGRDIATIASLADLVEIESSESVLKFFYKKNGGRKTGQLRNFARRLVEIAKYWAEVSPEHLAKLKSLRKEVDPGKGGMGEKTKTRLRPFIDGANVERLVRLPQRLFDEIGRIAEPTYNDAIVVQSALAIAIELVAPLRAKNLAGLRLDHHIVRSRPGPEALVHIVIPAGEVKNAKDLEFLLPARVARLLDVYLSRYKPLLDGGELVFLFPARKGGSKDPGPFGTQIKNAIKKATGLDMHLHLFRAFAGYVYLKRHPGDYESVRLLLGHKDITTTITFYICMEESDAFKRLDDLIESFLED
jgi:integrase